MSIIPEEAVLSVLLAPIRIFDLCQERPNALRPCFVSLSKSIRSRSLFTPSQLKEYIIGRNPSFDFASASYCIDPLTNNDDLICDKKE